MLIPPFCFILALIGPIVTLPDKAGTLVVQIIRKTLKNPKLSPNDGLVLFKTNMMTSEI